MLAYTNVSSTNPAGGTTFATASATLTGGNPYVFLWVPTARDLSNSTGGANILINDSERTASSCYMRGLKERIRITTTDGMPWIWRRVCFTYRGNTISSLASSTNPTFAETAPGGFRRLITNWSGINPLQELMFKGRFNTDWVDPLTAPLDNTRIKVMYDKTINIAAGNEEGCVRVFNRWHAMNKTLLYDDEENGDGKLGSFYSVNNRQGMGDYYVVDFIYSRLGATTSSQMAFSPEATLYWHEK